MCELGDIVVVVLPIAIELINGCWLVDISFECSYECEEGLSFVVI